MFLLKKGNLLLRADNICMSPKHSALQIKASVCLAERRTQDGEYKE